jgi:hypothetical protein
MKKKSAVLSFPQWTGVLLVAFALLAMAWQMRLPGKDAAQADTPLDGAWRLVKTTDPRAKAPEVVKILVDNAFTFAAYDQQQQRFIGAGGGTFSADKKNYTETLEYFTQDSTLVGTKKAYTAHVKGKTLQLSFRQNGQQLTETWQRIEFFSRDPKRVGMQVAFDYEVKSGDWHHRGLSTAGNKIYEVWTRGK